MSICPFAATDDERPPVTIEVVVTAPQCPLARDTCGTTWLLRAEAKVLPAELESGARLRLTGQSIISRPLLKKEACRVFDKIFAVDHAEALPEPEPGPDPS